MISDVDVKGGYLLKEQVFLKEKKYVLSTTVVCEKQERLVKETNLLYICAQQR